MEPPKAKSRSEKNRESAATSRDNKRERMGEEAFLSEKAEAERKRRKRKKEEQAAANAAAAAAAAAAAQVDDEQPSPIPAPDAAAQLAALAGLKAAGILDDDAFKAAAARVVAPPPAAAPAPAPTPVQPTSTPRPTSPTADSEAGAPAPTPQTAAAPPATCMLDLTNESSEPPSDDEDEPPRPASTAPPAPPPPAPPAPPPAPPLTDEQRQRAEANKAASMARRDIPILKATLEEQRSPDETLRALHRLESMPITRQILETTRIGVTVGHLRVSADAEVCELAAHIVSMWKRQLAEEKEQGLVAAAASLSTVVQPPPTPLVAAAATPSTVVQPPPTPLVATAAMPSFVPPQSATITAVSDALGVSSAQRLGAADLRKLRAAIDEPHSPKLVYVLRRLEVCSLTPELSRATDIDAAVARLSDHAIAEVRELSARIASAWSAQLKAELRRRELASRPGPKPSGTGALWCKACQGKHRPHTCK